MAWATLLGRQTEPGWGQEKVHELAQRLALRWALRMGSLKGPQRVERLVSISAAVLEDEMGKTWD